MDETVPQPPAQEPDPEYDFITKVKKRRQDSLMDLYKNLAELYAIERDFIIYRAIKKGFLSAYQMADVSELTPASIYKIVKRMESGDYGLEEKV